MLGSDMDRMDIQNEIVLYNQALETSYNEKANLMRQRLEIERKKRIKAEGITANRQAD